VAVEKLRFSQNSKTLGDRKCLGKSRKSFVGLPGAKFFRPVLRDQVFQHPQAITLIEGVLSVMGIFQQLSTARGRTS
jgi:hypothetical protein